MAHLIIHLLFSFLFSHLNVMPKTKTPKKAKTKAKISKKAKKTAPKTENLQHWRDLYDAYLSLHFEGNKLRYWHEYLEGLAEEGEDGKPHEEGWRNDAEVLHEGVRYRMTLEREGGFRFSCLLSADDDEMNDPLKLKDLWPNFQKVCSHLASIGSEVMSMTIEGRPDFTRCFDEMNAFNDGPLGGMGFMTEFVS